jgi:hypothetical protein
VYFELCPEILDQKYVKKTKFDVIFDPMIQKFDVALAVL